MQCTTVSRDDVMQIACLLGIKYSPDACAFVDWEDAPFHSTAWLSVKYVSAGPLGGDSVMMLSPVCSGWVTCALMRRQPGGMSAQEDDVVSSEVVESMSARHARACAGTSSESTQSSALFGNAMPWSLRHTFAYQVRNARSQSS